MNTRVFLSALVLLSVALLALGDVRDDHATWYPRTGPTPTIRKSGNLPNKFDFIIIGGGTAGCVLANRLSANPSNKVLLIEAGTAQDNTQLARIPVNWDMTPFSPFDHSYLNEGREILNWNGDDRHVAAGKALGGTTVINTLMWVRGNKLDYDLWNITGWSYNDLLPFFKKVETSGRYASAPNGAFYHGNNGPVKVGPSGWQPPEDEYLITAAANWGLPFNPDWNGESQIGSGFHEHTINEGIRVTSFSAYLKPILSRSNLWVMDNSEVQKIIFKKTGGKTRADAVRFIDNINGVSYTVSAAKEVVLSAGAIRSPQLLQLSGVGPVEELNRLGIPVVKNLQGVGRNLKDHVITTMSFGTAIGQPVAGATLDAAAFAQWNATKTGVVASITARTNFFFRSDFAADARPDGQIIVTPPGTSVFSLCYLNKPRSTGEVRLFSKDPSDLPLVTGNYLTHPTDLDAIIDIMNKTYQILQQAPIHAYPFNPAYDMTSRSALELYIKGNAAFFTPANAGSGYHFTSTCKMGVSSDPTAVVDSHLRVFGISGLRVADASIFPEIPTGNTQYPTYMVGERAASFILSDNNC